MFQSFSKIWIVVVVAIFAVAGIFCWQYFETQKEIEVSEEEVTQTEIDTKEFEGQILRQQTIAKQEIDKQDDIGNKSDNHFSITEDCLPRMTHCSSEDIFCCARLECKKDLLLRARPGGGSEGFHTKVCCLSSECLEGGCVSSGAIAKSANKKCENGEWVQQ